ncbi:hypothetical protein [Lysobacter gummosus]|uniref:hypothetical protein n=1 Tax=Lysobacter gummosus TaxID=262324 RepID=UPI003634013A
MDLIVLHQIDGFIRGLGQQRGVGHDQRDGNIARGAHHISGGSAAYPCTDIARDRATRFGLSGSQVALLKQLGRTLGAESQIDTCGQQAS